MAPTKDDDRLRYFFSGFGEAVSRICEASKNPYAGEDSNSQLHFRFTDNVLCVSGCLIILI